MTTFDFSGLGKTLHPGMDKRSAADRIIENLSTGNLGLNKTSKLTSDVKSVMDCFEVTTNISELLSPACGMTEEEKSAYLAHIQAKLKAGKKLTAEEMRFLQAEYPDLYLQAARVQSMRESFERQLKSCKTKEEAANVFSTSMSMVSDSDPMKEAVTAAYEDAYREYKETDKYKSLPENDKEKREKDS
ncbi:MAG: hypothetical protein PUA75_09945 [Clostridiales bacterium]|nr:hypothetical protein [Clostridiales bacterium]